MPRPTYLVIRLCIALTAVSVVCAYSQTNKPTRKIREFKSTFQFSLFPGISTNGIESGSFYNKYSFNFFGGLSRGNGVVELSPIYNATIRSTTGIQLAGLANVVGANAYINLTANEEHTTRLDDYESNQKGIQLAGLMNYVRNNATGIQLAGALTVVGEDFSGLQLSGIGNSAGGFAKGVQMAGFYNLAKESMAGIQISSLFNYTDGWLSGTQLALINKARMMAGGKTNPPTSARSLQIGIVNFSNANGGTQIGLINFGGESLGKQIGVINFFSRTTPQGKVRNGTPIGLLNYGSKGSYLSLYYSETFPTNLEYTTGNCLNCSRIFDSEMPFDDRNQIYNQNALILGYDPWAGNWGFGYGFQKVLYNKVTTEGSRLNKTRIITYGIKFLHLNKDMTFNRAFNLVNKLNLDYGKHRKWGYVYAGLSLNYFLHEERESVGDYRIKSSTLSAGELFGYITDLWPGYQFGIQF